MVNTYSLYLHIPTCTRKCDYCHFYVIPNKSAYHSLLLEGFLWEWKTYSKSVENRNISSIYFGGGTPSLFGPEKISHLLSVLPSKQCEITLEANPENISYNVIKDYHNAGINRLSIGIQALNDHELSLLTRQHNSQKAIESVEESFRAGIENISIDLMYDLPGQTLKSWRETLTQAVSLPITHLSLYNLTIEPHTVFFKTKTQLQSKLPSESVSTAMYKEAVEILTTHGFIQYEISAFCKPTYPSIHNSGYWNNRDFIGMGPSAFSYWDGTRFQNIPRLHQWHQALKNSESPIDYTETLSPEAREREKLVVRLRLLKGASLKDFHLDRETRCTIYKLIQTGLLVIEEQFLKLTNKGVLFYDTVASELI